MMVVAVGMRAGLIADALRRLGGGLSRRWPGLRRRDGDLSERRGLYLRWYLGSGSPSDSEVAVRST